MTCPEDAWAHTADKHTPWGSEAGQPAGHTGGDAQEEHEWCHSAGGGVAAVGRYCTAAMGCVHVLGAAEHGGAQQEHERCHAAGRGAVRRYCTAAMGRVHVLGAAEHGGGQSSLLFRLYTVGQQDINTFASFLRPQT